MARCTSCSAPLLANSNICRYCGIRNDIDLHAQNYTSLNQSERICPECDTAMHTIELAMPTPLHVERCKRCFGIFFDPGEIQILLENSVSGVFDINKSLMRTINKERFQNKSVKYVKCPDCRVLMNRVNFGHRSGVVIDQCKKHGIWLESGEIIHLLEWKKAGGQMLHKQHSASKQEPPLRNYRQSTAQSQDPVVFTNASDDLFDSLTSVVMSLFK